MEKLDLNIDNYSLSDILLLFNIDNNFNYDDLKNAKNIVYKSHPDKSGLNKEYFLFFTKAYKYLVFIYNFRKNNTNSNINNNLHYKDLLNNNEENNKNLDLLNNNKDYKDNFNKWFNNMFDEHNIINDFDKQGYGDWIKNDDNFNKFDECDNISKMNDSINNYKKNNYSIIKKDQFNELQLNSNNFSDLLNDKLEDYSSDIFSKNSYIDLKKAHEETLIPVSDNISRKNFNSVGDYEIFRNQELQKTVKYSWKESENILEENNNKSKIIDNQRAYRLAKQYEEAKKNNDKFWSKIKLLNK